MFVWIKVTSSLQGVLNGIGAVLPPMLERGKGDIVNISSGSPLSRARCWLFPVSKAYHSL